MADNKEKLEHLLNLPTAELLKEFSSSRKKFKEYLSAKGVVLEDVTMSESIATSDDNSILVEEFSIESIKEIQQSTGIVFSVATAYLKLFDILPNTTKLEEINVTVDDTEFKTSELKMYVESGDIEKDSQISLSLNDLKSLVTDDDTSEQVNEDVVELDDDELDESLASLDDENKINEEPTSQEKDIKEDAPPVIEEKNDIEINPDAITSYSEIDDPELIKTLVELKMDNDESVVGKTDAEIREITMLKLMGMDPDEMEDEQEEESISNIQHGISNDQVKNEESAEVADESNNLDADELENLLSDMGVGDEKPETKEEESISNDQVKNEESAEVADESNNLDADELENLLSDMGVGDEKPETKEDESISNDQVKNEESAEIAEKKPEKSTEDADEKSKEPAEVADLINQEDVEHVLTDLGLGKETS